MSRIESLAETVESRLAGRANRLPSLAAELAYEVDAARWVEVATELRDDQDLAFEQLVDLSGIDYLHYGKSEWRTAAASSSGFSRAATRGAGQPPEDPSRRFAVTAHLLSVSRNQRIRLRCHCEGAEPPMADSLVGVWPSANWFEREAFDLFGIVFRGHPDLRRILTDYGFIGHPFRKDFPLSGNVEVRYDPQRKRVVYEPVTIEPRVLVPKVIREDNRYQPILREVPERG